MNGTVTLTRTGPLAVARLGRAHGNAINGELVADLREVCREVDADPSIRGVLLASSGKLFCPGLDLQELSELDRPAMEAFFEGFSQMLLALYGLSKPVVVALHGHAVAGGCVLALTADWRVLREGALIGLNEVQVGLPLPFGVTMLLRESVSPSRLEEVALFGRNYKDADAVAVGLAHEIHSAEGFEAHCLARLQELADKGARAVACTKRYLRSATLAQFAEKDRRFAGEFIDAWFSPETRARVQGIVDGLRARP